MSEKRDSASFPDEEAKKKMKLDKSSSSRSGSNAKQEGDGSEEGASDPPASAMENKPRNQVDMDFSSGSVPKSINDQDSPTKKTATASASCSSKDQPSSSINPGSKKRILLYKRRLSHDDVSKFRIMVPQESGKKFIPELKKIDGKYQSKIILLMDHGQIWPMNVSFEELSSSYMLWLNWEKYFEKYGLETEDVIFIYYDPLLSSFGHLLVEYERKAHDSINPKKTTT